MKHVLVRERLIWEALHQDVTSEFDVLWEILQSREVQGYVTEADLSTLCQRLTQEQGVSASVQLMAQFRRVLKVYSPEADGMLDVAIAHTPDDGLPEHSENLPTLSVASFLERYVLYQLYQSDTPEVAQGGWYRRWRASGFDPMLLWPVALVLVLQELPLFQQWLLASKLMPGPDEVPTPTFEEGGAIATSPVPLERSSARARSSLPFPEFAPTSSPQAIRQALEPEHNVTLPTPDLTTDAQLFARVDGISHVSMSDSAPPSSNPEPRDTVEDDTSTPVDPDATSDATPSMSTTGNSTARPAVWTDVATGPELPPVGHDEAIVAPQDSATPEEPEPQESDRPPTGRANGPQILGPRIIRNPSAPTPTDAPPIEGTPLANPAMGGAPTTVVVGDGSAPAEGATQTPPTGEGTALPQGEAIVDPLLGSEDPGTLQSPVSQFGATPSDPLLNPVPPSPLEDVGIPPQPLPFSPGLEPGFLPYKDWHNGFLSHSGIMPEPFSQGTQENNAIANNQSMFLVPNFLVLDSNHANYAVSISN